MASDYPLKIFYDASCPVCALEMDQLRARDAAGRLELVDMSAPGFDAACHGFAHADLDAAIHAVRPDGTVVRGMPVLRLAYAAAGLGWLVRPTGFGPLRPLVRRGLPGLRPQPQGDLPRARAGDRRPACPTRARREDRVNVLVCGATGCIGRAVVQALRWRGHHVVAASRGAVDGGDAMALDFMRERSPADWAAELRARRIDAVVNCVGILMPGASASFARVHAEGPIELFRGAALAGVGRIVQVSALGVGAAAEAGEADYLRSKRLADEALLGLDGVDAAVVRPSLVFGPGSASAALFATLASLPVIGLPGTGGQRLQPIHVLELAEIVAGLVERTGSARGVYELGGKEPLDYRRMLEAYRRAQGLGRRSGCRCRCP